MLQAEAKRFIEESPLNKDDSVGIERIFDMPLFSVAQSTDPLFGELQKEEVVGAHHLLPEDWLDSANVVITYFLPFTQDVRTSNRIAGLPSIEWVHARIEGEQFNNALRRLLVDFLELQGEAAVAPAIDPRIQIIKRRSNWSERHVAFIAGLGTFGLSKSFITERGSAGRLGSVVSSVDMEASPRKDNDIYGNCSMCGACVPRCPAKAISLVGKDTSICAAYIDDVIRPKYAPRYGCGKCQTSVPCESRIPQGKGGDYGI